MSKTALDLVIIGLEILKLAERVMRENRDPTDEEWAKARDQWRQIDGRIP